MSDGMRRGWEQGPDQGPGQGPDQRLGQGRERGRWASTRAAAAVLLVAGYAVACAWSVWNRAHAIEFFAVASLLSAGFTVVSVTGRVVAGVLADLLAGGVAVALPVLGDIADATAALLAVALMSGKFVRLLKTLPYGLACLGLYLGLWSLAGQLPSALRHGPGWHTGAGALLLATTGVLYLLLVALLARLAGAERDTAVLHTVGYPWVLLMFLVTYFVPDKSPRTG